MPVLPNGLGSFFSLRFSLGPFFFSLSLSLFYKWLPDSTKNGGLWRGMESRGCVEDRGRRKKKRFWEPQNTMERKKRDTNFLRWPHLKHEKDEHSITRCYVEINPQTKFLLTHESNEGD